MPFWVADPFLPIFCGSSKITMGRIAAITSIGFLPPKSSRSSKMMREALFFAPSFMEVLKACMLMIMQETSEDCANESSSFSRSES